MMTKETVRKIMLAYLNEKQVDEMLPEVLICIENSVEDDELDRFDEVACVVEKYETDLCYFEIGAMIDQLVETLPSERPALQKPKNTVKVNVTADDLAAFLEMQPEYREGAQFIEFLRDAVTKNIGAFEVPVGYPAFDEFGRIVFVPECNQKYELSYDGMEALAKRNGMVFGDMDHFVLYLASIMNDIVKTGENPINVFYAATAMDDAIREGQADGQAVTRIRENNPLINWPEKECWLAGTNKNTTVCMSWLYDSLHGNGETAFFVINN